VRVDHRSAIAPSGSGALRRGGAQKTAQARGRAQKLPPSGLAEVRHNSRGNYIVSAEEWDDTCNMLIENPLNDSSLAFPILECFHIAGFVCGVGTIALVNLRLLGVGLTQKSAAQLWRDTMPWTLGGLSLVIFSGLLLFSTDPDMYYLNYAFLLKIAFLLLAIGFYYTAVHRAVAAGKGRVVACVSLALWALVFFGGIFIGFV